LPLAEVEALAIEQVVVCAVVASNEVMPVAQVV
jgi:hypothetical protein